MFFLDVSDFLNTSSIKQMSQTPGAREMAVKNKSIGRRRLYFTQLAISLMVLVFSMGTLIVNFSCETKSTLIPLITLVLGYWLPQPSP